MKTLLLLLLTFSFFTGNSQSSDEVRHCIFFLMPGNYHLRKVSEEDYCIIALKNTGRQHEGYIKRISSDTLFLNDTLIRTGDIAYFSFREEVKSPILLTKPSDLPSRFVVFPKDTLVWRAIIPPREIFTSLWEYKRYVKETQDLERRKIMHMPGNNHFRDKK
jgi:hypothetical protein